MVRVRAPGGVMTAAQYLALDAIAGRYANGTLKITSRQGIQFHGTVDRRSQARDRRHQPCPAHHLRRLRGRGCAT